MAAQRDKVVEPLRDCVAATCPGRDAELIAEALLGQVNGVVFGRLLRGESLDEARLRPGLRDLATRMVGGDPA